jgi:hypothetical protein
VCYEASWKKWRLNERRDNQLKTRKTNDHFSKKFGEKAVKRLKVNRLKGANPDEKIRD